FRNETLWRAGTEWRCSENAIPTVLFWGCMSASGTGVRHKKILKQSLLPSVKKLKRKRQWIFQQESHAQGNFNSGISLKTAVIADNQAIW
uniref:Uncharacterized protein n=1 Tax=Monopterus albus TaxID=43700 RepID=A0A3Q3R858_MONAL